MGTVHDVFVSYANQDKSVAEVLTFLAKLLTLGQPEGFIRTFVDEGKLLNIIEAEEQQRQASSGAVPSHPPPGA